MVSQLREIRERLAENTGLEVSLAQPELSGINADNNVRSTETSNGWWFRYKNTIKFLEDESDPLIVDIVLEIIDALRSEALAGQDVWEIPAKSTAQRLKEWSRKVRAVAQITKSFTSSQIQAELSGSSEDNQDSGDEEEEEEEEENEAEGVEEDEKLRSVDNTWN